MVISVASQKGGTGKTSTNISLAAGLAHKGKRVLWIDIDSQANSSKVLLHDYPQIAKEQTIYRTILTRSPLVIHETYVPNLAIVPSHILLSNTDIELTTAKDHRESRLKTELDKIKDHYDYIFIDNPAVLRPVSKALVDKCPVYVGTFDNLRYFLMDPKHPGKMLLVTIGQDNIPSGIGGLWDGTIKVLH